MFLIINVKIILTEAGKQIFETKSLIFVEEMNNNVNNSIEKFLKKNLVTTKIPSLVTPTVEGSLKSKIELVFVLKTVKIISPSTTRFVNENEEINKKKIKAMKRNGRNLLNWRKNIRFKKRANVNERNRAKLLFKNRIEIKIRTNVKNFTLTSIDGNKGDPFS